MVTKPEFVLITPQTTWSHKTGVVWLVSTVSCILS